MIHVRFVLETFSLVVKERSWSKTVLMFRDDESRVAFTSFVRRRSEKADSRGVADAGC